MCARLLCDEPRTNIFYRGFGRFILVHPRPLDQANNGAGFLQVTPPGRPKPTPTSDFYEKISPGASSSQRIAGALSHLANAARQASSPANINRSSRRPPPTRGRVEHAQVPRAAYIFFAQLPLSSSLYAR